MLSTYRRVLSLPGALAFSLSGLVGRLPISMVSLGIVVLVSTRTGSYSLAGSVSASYLIANAALAVPQARLVDRLGQHRVLPVSISVFAVGMVLVMVAADNAWPAPWPNLCAVVAGGAMPQIGSNVRARWSWLVPDKRDLQTAFAIEAVFDETVFVLGPTVVTILATAVHPLAGLVVAVVAGVAGTSSLVAQRRTEPPPSPRGHGHGPGEMPWRVLGPLTLSSFTMGMTFGGAEVATVAFADAHGDKALAGPLLAIWALGSLLSGAITGGVTLRGSNASRFRWGLLSLGVLMVPLPFVHSFALLGVLLFLAGFAISPTLIASVAWVQEIVPAGRITEGITVFTTGLAAGIAPGAWLVGIVVDAHGASQSYWVTAVSALVGAGIAFVTAAVARRTAPVSERNPSPTGSSS